MTDTTKYPNNKPNVKEMIDKFVNSKGKKSMIVRYNGECFFYTLLPETNSMTKILMHLYDLHCNNSYSHPRGNKVDEIIAAIGIKKASFMMNIWKLTPYFVYVNGLKTPHGHAVRYFKINDCGVMVCENLLKGAKDNVAEEHKKEDISS